MVGIVGRVTNCDEVIGLGAGRTGVRSREVLHGIHGDRIEASWTNLVVRKRTAHESALSVSRHRERVVDSRQAREIAAPHGKSRNRVRLDSGRRLVVSLKTEEKERSIAAVVETWKDHWTTQSSTILRLVRVGLSTTGTVGEEVVCVHDAIPMEFEQAPMPVIRARLSDQVNDTSAEPPILCRKRVRLDAKFLHGIDNRGVGGQVVADIVLGENIADPVQLLLVHGVTRAADVRSGGAPDVIHAWHQRCEAERVPPVERKVYHLLRIDDLAQGCRIVVERSYSGLHVHLRRNRA